MGHQYSNFPDAYTALRADWQSGAGWYTQFFGDFSDALLAWMSGDALGAIAALLGCVQDNMAMINVFNEFEGVDEYQSDILESIYWAAQGAEEYELTSVKICEAWMQDDFKDRALTIAFIDRMRQLIWDEPFSAIWAGLPETE